MSEHEFEDYKQFKIDVQRQLEDATCLAIRQGIELKILGELLHGYFQSKGEKPDGKTFLENLSERVEKEWKAAVGALFDDDRNKAEEILKRFSPKNSHSPDVQS
jgi:rubrerythrin